ncbi:hypothetical protein R83H12_03020 [Fibrobacteria bacterium R8-3-H12]
MRKQFTKIAQNFTILVTLIVGVIGVQTSYAANPPELVGQWFKENKNNDYMELFKDGTGIFYLNTAGKIVISWKVENKRFVIGIALGIELYDYKISGSKLTLTSNKGESITYVKGKAEYEKFLKAKEAEEAKEKGEERKRVENFSSYFTDSRDGNKYRSVKIGNQTWMAENLNYAGKNDDIGVCYGKKPENCKKYGTLYTWSEAMKVCPSGWHLPSEKEWKTLVDFAGGDTIAGKKLKAKIGWVEYKCKYEETTNRGNIIVIDKCSTDEFGFSALPGGKSPGGYFVNVGDYGYWWSASEGTGDCTGDSYCPRNDDTFARAAEFSYNYERYYLGSGKKDSFLSVRCLKD